MASQTPNLNLTLPVGTEKVSRQIINQNMTLIDQYCGAINQATYRPIPVTITVNDWVQSGGNWVYNFTTAYITASSDEWFMFSSSLADYAKAHIFAEKKSGGGGAVFTTAIKPTGAISCMIRVFDNDDHKVPVLMEGTVLPYANGGTNASTLNGAKENLGINALNTHITPSAVSVSPTYNSNIHNQELALQRIGKLVVGYLVFSYNSSFAGGDGNQEIIINNNGLPPASGGNQIPVTCVAGSSAGQTGRVRVTANGHLQFFYSNLKGKAGETYLVYLNYIAS